MGPELKRGENMTREFKEQGGAATMDPSQFRRWVQSRVISRMIRPEAEQGRHANAEKRRLATGEPHRVEYFHQVDDPYSALAAQCLDALQARYDIVLEVHLVTGPHGRNLPEPDMLLPLARHDAALVAPYYGLAFPQQPVAPEQEQIELAQRMLAAVPVTGFAALAAQIGEALFAPGGNLAGILDNHPLADDGATQTRLSEGDARIAELRHFSGAMFYYGDDWYWGVDRLYHLEQRLQSLGADREGGDMLYPRPAIDAGSYRANGSLTLEAYVSLRSPYTAVIFDRAVELAERAGLRLELKPVLPMVMRGVSLTRDKGMYIFRDAAREARALGDGLGPVYDPIGEPARRAYSLLSWAREQGRHVALFSAFLDAAFRQGVNTNADRGLRRIVAAAGLDWDEAKKIVGNNDWQDELEENRQRMMATGTWGVPSFRLLDSEGEEVFWAWGQDRLWVLAREVQRLLVQA